MHNSTDSFFFLISHFSHSSGAKQELEAFIHFPIISSLIIWLEASYEFHICMAAKYMQEYTQERKGKQ